MKKEWREPIEVMWNELTDSLPVPRIEVQLWRDDNKSDNWSKYYSTLAFVCQHSSNMTVKAYPLRETTFEGINLGVPKWYNPVQFSKIHIAQLLNLKKTTLIPCYVKVLGEYSVEIKDEDVLHIKAKLGDLETNEDVVLFEVNSPVGVN